MSSGQELLDEINEQINYTQRLEKAYLKKHDEVEFLYDKLQEMVYYLKVDKAQNPRINSLIKRIEKIVTRQSDEEEEQLEVLKKSKTLLEDINSKIDGKSKIPNLIDNLEKSIQKKSRRATMVGGNKKSKKQIRN